MKLLGWKEMRNFVSTGVFFLVGDCKHTQLKLCDQKLVVDDSTDDFFSKLWTKTEIVDYK